MKRALFSAIILILGLLATEVYPAKIKDVKLKIYNREMGEFREADYDFHFNEYGPFMFEAVLENDGDYNYYYGKNGLEITVKIGKKTVFRKVYSLHMLSDEYYFPVFIDEEVICSPVTVTAKIKGKKGSRFEKKFEFTCGE